jgi:hypothetical protein
MTDTARPDTESPVLAPNGEPVSKRMVLAWEVAAFFVINLLAGVLHFAFELSGFSEPMAVIASVNESAFEHLKLYFWPGVAFALVQHAYVRGRVNNYTWGKGLALLVTPIVVIIAFYFYVGIVVPIDGKGTLLGALITGFAGVLGGNIVSYRILTAEPKPNGYRYAGWVIVGVLSFLMATSAWLTPRFFLYEDFFGYEYTGQYGILDDYTDYLVFTGR